MTPEERARAVVAAIYRHIGVDSYSADEVDPKATALVAQAIREAMADAILEEREGCAALVRKPCKPPQHAGPCDGECLSVMIRRRPLP